MMCVSQGMNRCSIVFDYEESVWRPFVQFAFFPTSTKGMYRRGGRRKALSFKFEVEGVARVFRNRRQVSFSEDFRSFLLGRV